MPLTDKGEKIMGNMVREYGAEAGKRIFYASRNKGVISGVDPESRTASNSGDKAVRSGFQHLVGKSASLRRGL